MKKQELIKLIEELPDDADVFIQHGDDILGYYNFDDPTLEQDQAMRYKTKTGYVQHEATYSNFTPKDSEKVDIWILT